MTTAEFAPPHTAESFRDAAPDAYRAMIALGDAVDHATLEESVTELVKIRVSQVNGCAYCLQLHLNIARRVGVPEAKLGLVAVWPETSGVFTPRETAALAWAEQLARMPVSPVPETAWPALRAHFSEHEATDLTVAIANISAWNRLAGAPRFPPPIPRRD